MKRKFWIIVFVSCAALGGCFSPDPKSLTSDSPASKIPAIKDAAATHNTRAIPGLIADLDSNDSAIRFAAITALKDITGETFDYHYYDDQPLREPAVKRWEEWLKAHPAQ
ncbi:MAG: hypothetical protein M3O30_09065 [Planctomycetota bacterium]|nr:hypothetical protein [Planctomycetota bacterium]